MNKYALENTDYWVVSWDRRIDDDDNVTFAVDMCDKLEAPTNEEVFWKMFNEEDYNPEDDMKKITSQICRMMIRIRFNPHIDGLWCVMVDKGMFTSHEEFREFASSSYARKLIKEKGVKING